MTDLRLKTRIEAVGTVANGELKYAVRRREDGPIEIYKCEPLTLEEIMHLIESGITKEIPSIIS